jgi:glycosyltransferase involved in cell wall biosynthesis
MGFVKNPVFRYLLNQFERAIYDEAKSIVALSTAIQKSIEQRTAAKKIHLIPNMADTDFYRPAEKNTMLEKKYQVEGKFVISYIGALGFANGLDFFLDCARASERAALPVHFLLCGDGAMKENLKQSATRLDLKNISFIPFQNRDGVHEIMNVTNAVFVCYRSVPVLETGSPNKYFDGLSAGKLVVINFGGWIKDEIEKQRCGIQVDAKHPTDFVSKILPFLSGTISNEYGMRARALALSQYSRKALSEKFANIIKSNIASRSI